MVGPVEVEPAVCGASAAVAVLPGRAPLLVRDALLLAAVGPDVVRQQPARQHGHVTGLISATVFRGIARRFFEFGCKKLDPKGRLTNRLCPLKESRFY